MIDVGAGRRVRNCGAVLLCGLLAWAFPLDARSAADLDRAEQLSWMDAPAALQLLDTLQPIAQTGDALVQWLMARGIAYADSEQQQTELIIQRLHELGSTQASAEAVSHILRSYLYVHRDQYERAEAELKLIGAQAGLPAFVRYRLEAVRGTAQMLSGKQEAALVTYQRLRDMANAMHSTSRVVEALIKLAGLYTTARQADRSAPLVEQLLTIAQQSGDEGVWAEAWTMDYELADLRGDQAEQHRALLEALRHAQQGGSERIKAMVLVDLGSFYIATKAYAAALDSSTQALALARELKRPLFERLARVNVGLAQIGLGCWTSGKGIVESTIQQSLASGDLYDADDMMRQYRTALEGVGDLRGALQVWHREESVRDRLAANSREKALLELSAKFDNERRVRQIDLLKSDNTIKSRDLQMQRLRQQMIAVATALIALVCGALAWGILRIRKINANLLHNIEHDGLTGLLNRRYFDEHILAQQADRPYVGCLMLIAVDRLEYINDSVGYSAGDRVLSVIGRRLSSTLCDCDAIVRWASEVFLVMIRPMSDAELSLAARRLLSAIYSEPVNYNGVDVECTVSIGYASFPVRGAAVDIPLDDAITLVGKALRQAKRQGGDRACLITLVNANNVWELSAIHAQFEAAASDRRVQLVEIARTMA